MLTIRNATIFTPTTVIERGAIRIDGRRILEVGPTSRLSAYGSTVLDADGLLLAPGFFDLQINGGFGYDFTAHPETIWSVAAALPEHGVTSFLPTIISSPPETVRSAQLTLEERPHGFRGSQPLGLHLEGPYLNPGKKGAHDPEHLRVPAASAALDWSPASGVRLATLAPELPGSLELIASLAARGVIVAAGHSLASFEEARTGFEAGICYGTHLFNAMGPLKHREPGLVGALLADKRVTVGLIADGIHLHPAVVKLIWQMAGDRVNLVTDAMAALGKPPGQYQLGDRIVLVSAIDSRLPDGTLAGSILTLDAAVRNLIAFAGCSLSAALATVTTTPAKLLGLEKKTGQIAPGLDADLVLLTPDLEVVATMVAGTFVYGNLPTVTRDITVQGTEE